MAFDDVARQMASRHKQKLDDGDPHRRMIRTIDLVLGPLFLAGGIVLCVYVYGILREVFDPTPDPNGPILQIKEVRVPIGLTILAPSLVIAGLVQTIKGLRSR
jgi:hypothetical protein